MADTHQRQLDPEAKPDDRVDNALRPQKLAELIGQDQVKENLGILIAARASAAKHWITFCSMARRVWEKQPWRMSLPMRWASISKSHPAPPLSAPEI